MDCTASGGRTPSCGGRRTIGDPRGVRNPGHHFFGPAGSSETSWSPCSGAPARIQISSDSLPRPPTCASRGTCAPAPVPGRRASCPEGDPVGLVAPDRVPNAPSMAGTGAAGTGRGAVRTGRRARSRTDGATGGVGGGPRGVRRRSRTVSPNRLQAAVRRHTGSIHARQVPHCVAQPATDRSSPTHRLHALGPTTAPVTPPAADGDRRTPAGALGAVASRDRAVAPRTGRGWPPWPLASRARQPELDPAAARATTPRCPVHSNGR